MKVSILMPTFNQAEFIPAAMDSLGAQTFGDFEFIACDDGSTDNTAELLRENGVRFFQHGHNRGAAEAINTCQRFGSGQFLTWISSDNVMTPDWLQSLVAEIHDDVGAVYSGFWYESPGRAPHQMFTPYDPNRLINQEECYFGPSFLIRASVWQEAGSHRGKISHDYDHWLRVEEACWKMGLRIVGIPVPLCHYNAHDKRATVLKRDQYDAPHWQVKGRKRRELARSHSSPVCAS